VQVLLTFNICISPSPPPSGELEGAICPQVAAIALPAVMKIMPFRQKAIQIKKPKSAYIYLYINKL
jgi:hypothetical protein